jgi:hypothetical protein
MNSFLGVRHWSGEGRGKVGSSVVGEWMRTQEFTGMIQGGDDTFVISWLTVTGNWRMKLRLKPVRYHSTYIRNHCRTFVFYRLEIYWIRFQMLSWTWLHIPREWMSAIFQWYAWTLRLSGSGRISQKSRGFSASSSLSRRHESPSIKMRSSICSLICAPPV